MYLCTYLRTYVRICMCTVLHNMMLGESSYLCMYVCRFDMNAVDYQKVAAHVCSVFFSLLDPSLHSTQSTGTDPQGPGAELQGEHSAK